MAALDDITIALLVRGFTELAVALVSSCAFAWDYASDHLSHIDLSLPHPRLLEYAIRAPIDFLEQAPSRRFQSNEIVPPINSWPNDNTILGPYEIFDGLANISDI